MTVILDGSSLSIEKLVGIARGGDDVELPEVAIKRIVRCRDFFEEKLRAGEIIYGVNTGVGELSETVLDSGQMEEAQKRLIRSHASGIGDPAPPEFVRGAMAGRINLHAKGQSACRPEITFALAEMLNRGITPVVCLRGSVGASGDLAPMAQIALLLMGEGEAYYQGERLPGRQALDRAGITPPGFKPRDGLSVINGSNFITAASAIQLYDIDRLLRHAEIACAMSLEALKANLSPFNLKLSEVRGFPGSILSAKTIMACLRGGDLYKGKIKARLQDAYSLRSTPQIIGSAHDMARYAALQVETELNGICDNPVFFPEESLILTGANFQSMPVSLPMDTVGAAVTAVCVLSERRLNRLMNPALSAGLPTCLIKNPGINSGMMISQYTTHALIAEQRILSAPASVQSIPSNDQEDFVSMGMTTVIKNMQIYENAASIIGIELMAAAQALDIRGHRYGEGTETARKIIRKYIEPLEEDRPLHTDHNMMKKLVQSGEILDELRSEN